MLYETANVETDAERAVLYHPFETLSQPNGLRQAGNKIPSQRNTVTTRLRRTTRVSLSAPSSDRLKSISNAAPSSINNELGNFKGFQGSTPLVTPPDYDKFDVKLSGLDSWFSKATRKISSNVRQFVRKPISTATTVAAKLSTGGITLITETGVLGKTAKKAGKKAETVAAGAIGGTVAGAVAGGGNPFSAIAGGAAGGVKGLVEATRTSGSGNIVKSLEQGAVYGALAGGATKIATLIHAHPVATGVTALSARGFVGGGGPGAGPTMPEGAADSGTLTAADVVAPPPYAPQSEADIVANATPQEAIGVPTAIQTADQILGTANQYANKAQEAKSLYSGLRDLFSGGSANTAAPSSGGVSAPSGEPTSHPVKIGRAHV